MKDLDISNWSEQDLRALSRKISSHLKQLRAAKTKNQLLQFSSGDYVYFETKYGELIFGYVVRLNQKTVTIEPELDDERIWRVSPGLLTKVEQLSDDELDEDTDEEDQEQNTLKTHNLNLIAGKVSEP